MLFLMNQALLHRELNGRFKRPHSCFKLALIHALETCEPVDFVRVFKLNRAPADEWIRRRAYPSLERFLDFHPGIEMLSPDWFTFMINATWIMTSLNWIESDEDGASLKLHHEL
jgi:hypothetical protein